MSKLHYIPGSKLLLSRILEKKTDLELLEEEFCTVSEIPLKLSKQSNLPNIPNYSIKSTNITLQFSEIDTEADINKHLFSHILVNDYYKDKTIFLAGDPTGSIYFIIKRKMAENLKLDKKTFNILHIAIVVIFNKIYLQALEDTKFVKCSSNEENFINTRNNITLDLNSIIT
ncbi:hypothetical protein MACK_003848 [Theileria orientalis]|uniref:Uncharacterized protein n=1 Tax=Theileria orientalis TaxID=68886 RepID=A0A976XHR8_THEOR|nr:hypothetical protein MACK_003848 [Theileria orientalis]